MPPHTPTPSFLAPLKHLKYLLAGVTALVLIGGLLSAHPARAALVREQVAAGTRTPVAASERRVTLPKSCTAPRPPKVTNTPFGVSLSPAPTLADDRRVEERRFGNLRIVRVFDPTIPPDNAWERRTPQLKGLQVATSFRMPPQQVLAGKYDRQLKRFFRQAPRAMTVYWTYFHEPEPEIDKGAFTAAQYRRAWRHIALIAGSFCKPRLYPTLILTGWTAEKASGRSLATYFPGRRYISVLAWDPYNQAVGTPSAYRPVADVFAPAIRVSRAARLPWAVAETGTARVSGDPGHGRAAWIRSMGAYLRKHGAQFVTYFQSTNRGDFELRDQPSIDAYRPYVES